MPGPGLPLSASATRRISPPRRQLLAGRLQQTDVFGDPGNGPSLHRFRHDLALDQLQIRQGFGGVPGNPAVLIAK